MAAQTIAYPDAEALAEGACSLALGKIEEALQERGRACLVLAGGTTPRETYSLLAREIVRRKLSVEKLLWLFGDERWVPVSDPRSNERMARETLLGPIGAPPQTVLSWRAGAGDPVECAGAYTAQARRVAGDAVPDLLFLGMGADGHTASLFPDGVAHLPGGAQMPVARDIPGYAAAVYAESAGGWRLTLCPEVR